MSTFRESPSRFCLGFTVLSSNLRYGIKFPFSLFKEGTPNPEINPSFSFIML